MKLLMNFKSLIRAMKHEGVLNAILIRTVKLLNSKYFVVFLPIYLNVRNLIFRLSYLKTQRDMFPLAVYDLRANASTFDFCFFMYEAECHFRSKGLPEFDILIVPLFSYSDWENVSGHSSVITEQKKYRRVFNLLLPLAALYVACRKVILLDFKSITRELLNSRLNLYPINYDGFYLGGTDYIKIYDFERRNSFFSGFQAHSDDLKQVHDWLILNKVNLPFITITLRTYGFQSKRNSDVQLINNIATYLKQEGFDVVLVPDTDDLSGSNSFNVGPCFLPGTFNIFQRNALYETAYTNFFSSNGTHALSVLNLNSSFIFSKLVNEYWKIEDLQARGLKYGSQPWGKGRGVWIWEEETFESVIAAFEQIRVFKGSPFLTN